MKSKNKKYQNHLAKKNEENKFKNPSMRLESYVGKVRGNNKVYHYAQHFKFITGF